mmetsp:Transcript_44165/g.64933  ORF Transcript_44165/g.64933 Transcript_44165/m.64933 type:complete len:409 (+) Transcript_44165:138-1364(+)
MPWLIKGQKNPEENLLFIHVPRCGGTSLSHHFSVEQKAAEECNLWHKSGMKYFFRRYKLLESANFPFWTRENLIALIMLITSITLRAINEEEYSMIAKVLFAVSMILSFCSTILATAPVVGRVTPVRRCYLWFVHFALFRWMESIPWLTGSNQHGYMMHLTSQKLLAYGYVTPEEMDNVCSMAIVRNPYSRMVSVYMYNRFGEFESFSSFVERWYKLSRHYRERREMEEYYTPCHLIPQFEFTHFQGKQLVQSVVKQEELKLLKTKDEAQKAIAAGSSVADLPGPVRNALLGMPHNNARSTKKKWWDYYDQETLNITYEMYKKDFQIFEYSPKLDKRPDLKSARPTKLDTSVQSMRRNSTTGRLSSMMNASVTGASVATITSSAEFRKFIEEELDVPEEKKEMNKKDD